jgi:hypothetical protein
MALLSRFRRDSGDIFRALQHQFPELLLFSPRSRAEFALLVIAMLLVGFALGSMFAIDRKGLLVLLVSAPMGVFAAVLAFLVFRGLRIYLRAMERDRGSLRSLAGVEEVRFDGAAPDVPHLALPGRLADIRLCFDSAAYYRRPPVIEDMLRWHSSELEPNYVMGRGALDRPKLALVKVERKAGKVLLMLGGCSYYDKVCIHDGAHRVLSDVKISTAHGRQPTSLLTAFGEAAGRWYKDALGAARGSVDPWPYAPNALGVSGLVRIKHAGRVCWVIQVRGGVERADLGLLDCTFAGLVELEEFLDGRAHTVEELLNAEFEDEAPSQVLELAVRCGVLIEPLAILFEPDRLYQPELLALYTIECPDEHEFDGLLRRQVTDKPAHVLDQTKLLATVQAAAHSRPVSLGRDVRVGVKDNLATALSLLVARGEISSLPTGGE